MKNGGFQPVKMADLSQTGACMVTLESFRMWGLWNLGLIGFVDVS
jgi:hypothetical protein